MESKDKIKLESIHWFNLIFLIGSIIFGLYKVRFYAITVGCIFEYFRIYPNLYAKIVKVIPIDLESIGFEILCFICYAIIMMLFIQSTFGALFFFLAFINDKSNSLNQVISMFLFCGGVLAATFKDKNLPIFDENNYINVSIAIFLAKYLTLHKNKILFEINKINFL